MHPEWPKSHCDGLTAEEAAYNLLKVFFDQTRFAEDYGGTRGKASMQWVELDYVDILYAQTHPPPVSAKHGPLQPVAVGSAGKSELGPLHDF